MITVRQKNIIKTVLEPYNPKFIGIFGSYATNEQTGESDIDILVDFAPGITLLDIIGMEQELTERLGCKVDLVTKSSVNKYIDPYIQKNLIKIA